MTGSRSKAPRNQDAGFTLIELIVVLAVIGLWAMMLVPALARTQSESHAFHCLDNHAQLCRAWLMYADDNHDQLATSLTGSAAQSPTQPMWAAGWLDWSLSTANTNVIYLTDSRYAILATYCNRDASLFKCPADQFVSSAQRNRGWRERARSVSQNRYAANSIGDTGPSDATYAQVTKLSELLNPKPASTWVSMDEHPDSINDGGLWAPHKTEWVDLPGNYHDGATSVAFADGHVEMHRWEASVLNYPIRFVEGNYFAAPLNDPDIQWLRYRTPRKPGMN